MQPLPTYSLTPDIKTQLHNLITTGTPVKTAATELGCNYIHALNYAHNTDLIPHRTRGQITDNDRRFLDLVRSGVVIAVAARTCGIERNRSYRLAADAGLRTPTGMTQRRINPTNLRVQFLRLRTSGYSRRQAADTLGVDRRAAFKIDRGIGPGNPYPQPFIPAGPKADAYNRLMTDFAVTQNITLPAAPPESTPPGPAAHAAPATTPPVQVPTDPFAPINPRYLSITERTRIADLRRAGYSLRAIARKLGRSHSSISRELARNTPSDGDYGAETAQYQAACRRVRPKRGKLARPSRLRDCVVDRLRAEWSPEQISAWLARMFPHEKEMQVSCETIYEAFYLTAKGGLKNLGLSLPTGRTQRRKHGSGSDPLCVDTGKVIHRVKLG